jgi:hypothetical protein
MSRRSTSWSSWFGRGRETRIGRKRRIPAIGAAAAKAAKSIYLAEALETRVLLDGVAFAAKADYAAGYHPLAVTVADLNGDSAPDWAVAASYSDGVCVLLNKGNGTACPPTYFSTGVSYPNSVAAADFNGDGKIDLAVASGTNNSVAVFLNLGNGTFAPKADYAIGSGQYSVTAADLNGDGKADLAVTADVVLYVLINNGNGTFLSAVDYPAQDGPQAAVAVDLNGDDRLDIVVSNSGSGTI